jgi:tetratricopeptide (TPR) repeat protein/DNA-binding response OmpR family regulator
VLVVGARESLLPGLEAALQRHRVHVETFDLDKSAAGAARAEGWTDAIVTAVMAAAPDLVLLVGNAEQAFEEEVLNRLMSSPLSSVVPVAILDDNTALDVRLRAFRHGAAAVIPRSASIDAIADQVARLAREIPERGSESLGVVGEATLHEFVGALSKELRNGILTVTSGKSTEKDAVRLVLGSGRPLAHFIDDFVSRVRKHVVLAEPLRYEFDERASGTVQLLGGDVADVEAGAAEIAGLRLALADDDAARADSVAQELRQHGASVAVSNLNPSTIRFTRLRQVDPAVLLIGESHLQGQGYELVRRMRHDTRLRWASLLVVRWDELWVDEALVPAVARLKGTLAALAEPERAIRERAESSASFDTRIEVTGAARCLRALASVSHPVRATFYNPRVRVEVDVSEGLIVGATGETLDHPSRRLEGPAALAALLVLSSGRVHVARVDQPASANIMSTVDVALDLADAERPPLSPSLPAPRGATSSAPDAPASARDRAVSGVPQARVPQPLGRSRRIRVRTAVLLVVLATLLSSAAVVALYVAKQNRNATVNANPAPASPPLARPAVPAVAARPPRTANASAPRGQPAPKVEAPEPMRRPSAPSSDAPPSPVEPDAPLPEVERSQPEKAEPTAETAKLTNKLPVIREPVQRARSCASLTGTNAPAGTSRARALEQLQRARRELVRGDLDAAQRAFCLATQADTNNGDAMTGLARLLLLRRDARAAAEWARRAVKLRPDDVQARALLGDALARTGDLDTARAAWLASTGAAPNDPASLRAAVRYSMDVAERALEQRDSARAERFFRRSALLDSRNPEAALGLARALVLIGDLPAARAWADRARLLAPRDAELRVRAGDVLAQAGDKVSAEREWRQALAADPNHVEAQKRLRRLEQRR